MSIAKKAEFDELLEEVRAQLLEAQMAFDTWYTLLPTENNGILNTLNRYKGFFQPVTKALLDRYFIKIFNLLDKRQVKAPSFYSLFKLIENFPDLAPSLKLDEVKARIEGQGGIQKKVAIVRHKRSAHYEIGAKIDPIEISEVSSLLEDLRDIFNEIYKIYYAGKIWSFQPVEKSDTKNLLQNLQSYHRIISPAIFIAGSATQDRDNPSVYLVDAKDIERLKEALNQM